MLPSSLRRGDDGFENWTYEELGKDRSFVAFLSEVTMIVVVVVVLVGIVVFVVVQTFVNGDHHIPSYNMIRRYYCRQ
jgi:hypothetical protein